MSKQKLAVAIYKCKRAHEELIMITGQLFSIDELLTRFLGREVSEAEGLEFVSH